MTGRRRFFLIASVAILAGAAGALFSVWQSRNAAQDIAPALTTARFTDLQGASRSLAQWHGKVLVVNLWATWCAPCREEIPVFIKLQDKYGASGLQFVGIAIDRRDPVQAFVREFGINYPVFLGDMATVELSRRGGNRAGALPFTFIIDRNGKIVGTELGKFNQLKLEYAIQPLL